MRFEEALKAMREGKKVKRPIQLTPRVMRDGRICEAYKTDKGIWKFIPMDGMNCCNIIAGDWEEVVDE